MKLMGLVKKYKKKRYNYKMKSNFLRNKNNNLKIIKKKLKIKWINKIKVINQLNLKILMIYKNFK